MSQVDGEVGGAKSGILQKLLGPQGAMQAAGLFLTFAAVIAFGYAISSLIYKEATASSQAAAFSSWHELVLPYVPQIGLIVIGFICALLALRLFSKAGAFTNQVVRPAEAEHLWPLIKDANKDAINEYIRLASLQGFPELSPNLALPACLS